MIRRLIAALALTTMTVASPASGADEPRALTQLRAEREPVAAALAAQAAFCASRRDTGHFAFAGCIDWHSAVHATWAMVAYRLATGDTRHDALIRSILSESKLAQERAYVRDRPTFEMPYGRAWFLRLALDADRAGLASDGLLSFADEIAEGLLVHLAFHPDPLSGSYDSASWGFINLIDYARHRGLEDLETSAVIRIEDAFIDVDPSCPYGIERGHFMAVCTNWASLAIRVLQGDERDAWLDLYLARNGLPDPVTRQISAHHFGLNFSRAWGLWDIYAATGRADVAAAYADHVLRGLVPNSNWNGDYRRVGHWVAQFGMFAVQPLFGSESGR